MKSILLAVSALVMAAGSASASNIMGPSASTSERVELPGSNVADMGYGLRSDFLVDVSGRSSWDALADASNTVLTIDVAAAVGLPSGSSVDFTGIGWDVEIQTTLAGTFGGSWLSEARFTFGTAALPNQLNLRPGSAVSAGGTQRFTSGVVDFASIPLPAITLADGLLRIELNESFDDSNDEIDANYLANSFLTIRATPAPGAMALLGLGGLAAARRRRN